MIRVTVHRKLADGSPSLSVSPRRGLKTFEDAANTAMRLLADEMRQPGQERRTILLPPIPLQEQ